MRTRLRVPAAVPAFLIALYPLSVVLSVNAGVVLPDAFVVVRYVAATWAGVSIILWILRPVIPDFRTRAAWVNWLVLTWMLYVPALHYSRARGIAVDVFSPWFAVLFTILGVGLATAVTRPWKQKPRDPWPMTVTALTLLALSGYQWTAAVNPFYGPDWRQPADMMIRSTVAASEPRRPTRDIFYIVLDGMGSPRTLRDDYQLDARPFVEFLRSRGFHVAEDARSNYAQTYLSLASTLNLSYLDPIAQKVGTRSGDRRPLHYLIQRNALMKMARLAGYRITVIGSDYQATEKFSDVDVCLCPRYGLDEVELAALSLTPMAALPLDRWTFDAHRRKVLDSFSAIERVSTMPGPNFVFVHIVAPHPPFLFGSDGSPRRPLAAKAFLFADGDHFPGRNGEYRDGYRQQASFVMRRVQGVIESLLNRAGPEPVVVIHGDHGPGFGLQWESPEQTKLEERLGIFLAYKFPGDVPPNPAIASPINGARALARAYLSADLPDLQDESYFSRWTTPYEFVRVSRDFRAPESSGPRQADVRAEPATQAQNEREWLTSAP